MAAPAWHIPPLSQPPFQIPIRSPPIYQSHSPIPIAHSIRCPAHPLPPALKAPLTPPLGIAHGTQSQQPNPSPEGA